MQWNLGGGELTGRGKAGTVGVVSEETSQAPDADGGEKTPADGELICRITPWYYRRMTLMTLMLLACACC